MSKKIKPNIKMGIDWGATPPGQMVKVNSMYTKKGEYVVWTGDQVLKYNKNSVWSLGNEQNYTQILRQSFGVASDMTPLKNMLKKLL